ncbi:hypothetical protein GON03_14285 [Nocardioides sp. MAH-18]|uniref:Permease n=1 Tax=Nocardioides agri TaxID=2682843 RepID=A0A6L6XT26_9ACTN|nr:MULTISPECIES: hypothetical protein [unclassified Nocardioides]MBA2955500.1 hypothetical protein [Nocardioides sp. CGMCC 1.13656]MVQ50350.1 hypothetical protein [Nocardioides sp. MAH-18]
MPRYAPFVAAAVLLGVLAEIAVRGATSQIWTTVGTPWLLLAFAAGRRTARPLGAAAWGAGLVLLGFATYYAWLLLVQGMPWTEVRDRHHALGWLALGAVAGAACGLVGVLSRHPRPAIRTAAWSLVVAIPLVDLVVWVRGAQEGRLLVVVGLGLVAAALFTWALRAGHLQPEVLIPSTVLATVLFWEAQLVALRALFDLRV